MRLRTAVILVAGIVLLNIAAHFLPWRWDLTDDHRYSLSQPTCQWMKQADAPIEVEWLLQGNMNSGFQRLNRAGQDLLAELNLRAPHGVRVIIPDSVPSSLPPMVIHERTTNAQTAQTTLYPYAIVHYKGRAALVELLRQNRGLSGEENLNLSIENLEFAFMEALRTLEDSKVQRVAFLEGHGELDERHTYDFSEALSHYFQVDRGVLGTDDDMLDAYQAVIIADPQQAFSESDKYIIDQYIMRGGRVLWLLNGVRFSNDYLATSGKTPIIPLDLNLTDMLFRYGVRVRANVIQDQQCMLIPVDVSQDSNLPNWQPMPWTYAPLLLTSNESPVTRNLMQVSCTLPSSIDYVGEDDGLEKDILLATSSASRVTATPAEVDLSMNNEDTDFPHAYIPVAGSVSGIFTSLYAHQSPPSNIVQHRPQLKQSQPTRQIIVAAGSIARNEWQQGYPLPVGYDRYTGTQFGNRDFLTNSVLWLTDEEGWMALRNKSITLRLINDSRARAWRTTARTISILTPILLLAIVGVVVMVSRKKHYML